MNIYLNKVAFLPIIKTLEFRHFAFLCLANELMSTKQIISFGKPYYQNPELAISVIIKNESSANYLDLCILAMEYDSMAEVGARRVIIFPSIEDKNEFRDEFPGLYNAAKDINKKLNGLDPVVFHLMACSPTPIELADEINAYSVILSFNMGSDLFKILWLEEIRKLSENNIAHTEKMDDGIDWNNIKITFTNKLSRDNYLQQLTKDTEAFNCTLDFYQNTCNKQDTLEMSDVIFLMGIEMLGHDLWPGFDTSDSEELLIEDFDNPNSPTCDEKQSDQSPIGFGHFGLSLGNPIPTQNIQGSTDYLTKLKTTNGHSVTSFRLGSVNQTENSERMIDIYLVSTATQETSTLYFYPYHDNNSNKAPVGFVYSE